MSTTLTNIELFLSIGSILASLGAGILLKRTFHKYKRPNGKKGGIISLHVIVAFAAIAVVAIVSKDWFLTGLTVLLAYLIGRGRTEEGQHYTYQVALSAIIGVAIPYGIFYMYYHKKDGSNNTSSTRVEYDDKPEKATDDRNEADEAPELRLEDDD